MEAGDKLRELDLTKEEMERLTKALKDEKFGEMLRDYAQELSDPENKRRYEEEIALLEQERGNTIEFIHPQPFRCLRTSVDGKQKCFVNICANEKVGKPECKCVSEEGRRGQRWSLPHSLHPGRPDTNPKGTKMMIYDVIFHPDTLHMASRNKRFMDMVDSTALQGIQDAFKVTLDEKNVKVMRMKYKGTPQPCVVRKPIPGYQAKEPSGEPDSLAFPYPDDNRPPMSQQFQHTESSRKPTSSSMQPQKATEPTKPKYTVKYRSYVDLQDFRYSRDSAQSPRPKEIIVIIDVPLLKAASDASLEVKERQLLLESMKPAYRLELPLAYPVDEDKGEAKFNKQRGQLTVTLSVLPSDEAFSFATQTGIQEETQEEMIDKRDEWKEEQRCAEDLRQQTAEEEEAQDGEEPARETQEGEAEQETWREQKREAENNEELRCEENVNEEKLEEQKHENANVNPEKSQQDENNMISDLTAFQCDAVEEISETEKQPILMSAERCIEEGDANVSTKTSDIKEETVETRETLHGNEKVETEAASPHHKPSEESQTSRAAIANSQNTEHFISQESSQTSATQEAHESSSGGSDNKVSEEPVVGSVKNGDNLLMVHKPPPVLLREIDDDGNEKIISDHSTSAGFIFQNSLVFELD